jgi:uncharacterized membrane protein/thiol-disulfide isomerase/thioredoxin
LINVVLYVKPDCAACDEVKAMFSELKTEYPHELQIVDVTTTSRLKEIYADRVPVVKTGPYLLTDEISIQKLKMTLGASIDRNTQLTNVGDERFEARIKRGDTVTRTDRVSFWLSDSYIWFISFFLLLYAGLPFLAPVLLKAGFQGPANVIYTIYRPLCHQLAFRSWFIYGEQPFYPRSLAGVEGVITYESIMGEDEIDLRAAQHFNGNEVLGYKVALCQRDTAIYASMLLFALVFIISGRKIKSLPWYIWLVLGIVPIGLDGTSQLPGLVNSLPAWLPIRESTPVLRTITGSLFGFMTAWYLFPLIEESMRETKLVLEEKIKVNNVRKQK